MTAEVVMRPTVAAPEAARRRQRSMVDQGELGANERVGIVEQVCAFVRGKSRERKAAVAQAPAPAPADVDEPIGLAATGTMEPELADAIADAVYTIVDGSSRARGAAQRLAAQANPRAGRQRPPGTIYEPTPERAAKAVNGLEQTVIVPGAGPVKAVVNHRVKSTVEQYRDHFTEDEVLAAARFRSDAETTTQVNITARYDGMPRSGSNIRTSHISDSQREAHARFQGVCRIIEQVDPAFLGVMTGLVLEIRSASMDRPLTVHDIGRKAMRYTDRTAHKVGGLMLLRAALMVTGFAYRQWDNGNRIHGGKR